MTVQEITYPLTAQWVERLIGETGYRMTAEVVDQTSWTLTLWDCGSTLPKPTWHNEVQTAITDETKQIWHDTFSLADPIANQIWEAFQGSPNVAYMIEGRVLEVATSVTL